MNTVTTLSKIDVENIVREFVRKSVKGVTMIDVKIPEDLEIKVEYNAFVQSINKEEKS